MRSWKWGLGIGVFVAMIAQPAIGAKISRCTKYGGAGTAFVDGNPLTGAELNCDVDAIFNEFNGSISSANIADNTIVAADIATGGVATAEILDGTILAADFATGAVTTTVILDGTILDADVDAAAALDPAKIDDFSNDATEMQTTTDPGDSGSESLATDLTDELERLRYVLQRLGPGLNATSLYWYDEPIQGPNLLTNGSFEANPGADSAPLGWTDGETVTLSFQTTDLTEGEGDEVTITSGAADQALTQTLTDLKASHRYLAVARVNATAGDTCSLLTTGATTNAAATSATTGSYETVSSVFITDATVTAVVLRLESNGNGDVCNWDHVAVYELGSDRISGSGLVASVKTDNDAGTGIGATPTYTTILSSDPITIPGPGYMVEIHGYVTLDCTASDFPLVDLYDGSSVLAETQAEYSGASAATKTISVYYLNPTPTVASSLTYSLRATEQAVSVCVTAAGINANGHMLAVKLIPVW